MKSQQQARDEMEVSVKAAFGATRQYFSGAGAKGRTATFLKQVGKSFVYLVTGFLGITSWAVVCTLLVGFEHEEALRSFHAWMIATPVDQVVAKGNALVSENAPQYLAWAVLLAVMWRLGDVTKPAILEAQQRHRAEIAKQIGHKPKAATND